MEPHSLFVGTNKNNAGGSSVTVTYTATSGNLLRVGIWTNATSGTPSVSDNGAAGGSTYAQAVWDITSVAGKLFGEYYTCVAASGITSETVNIGSPVGLTNLQVIVLEYSYSGGVCNLGTPSTAGTGTGTTFTAGSITTATPHALIAGIFKQNASQALSNSSPYTARSDIGDGGTGFGMVDDIVSVTGTYAAKAAVGWLSDMVRIHDSLFLGVVVMRKFIFRYSLLPCGTPCVGVYDFLCAQLCQRIKQWNFLRERLCVDGWNPRY